MRFLADMGVSIRVVEWLCSNGHDAKHLREEGLHRMPNGEIFTKATHENRILNCRKREGGDGYEIRY